MMKFFVFPVFLLCSFLGFAQTDSTAQLRHLRLEEVRVFGIPVQKYAAGSRTSVIDSSQLKNYRFGDLGELLQQHSALYLKSYGSNMLSTASFRGTGANHTAVLWNGFNVNSPTLGQTDFSIVPLFSLDQVVVHSGSSGALYGSGAVGGSIELSTLPDWQPGSTATLQQRIGSFSDYRSQFALRYSKGDLEIRTAFYRNTTENNFRYRDITRFGIPIARQAHAAIRQCGLSQDIYYRLSASRYMAANLWYNDSWRQLQPPMSVPKGSAMQGDANLRFSLGYHQHGKAGYLQMNSAYFYEWMQYDDKTIHSTYLVQRYFLRVQHEVKLTQQLFLKSGAEGNYIRANVSEYSDRHSEKRADFFTSLQYLPSDRIELTLNLRKGFATGFHPPLTPAAGLNFKIVNRKSQLLTFKAMASTGYRVPALNERYWKPGGNPAIRPEHSVALETGLRYQTTGKKLATSLELTHFRMALTDMIIWAPADLTGDGTDNLYWSPVNVEQAFSRGVEISGTMEYKTGKFHLKTGLNAAFCKATAEENLNPWQTLLINRLPERSSHLSGRQLMYVPRWNGSAYASLQYRSWLLTLHSSYTGLRYTTTDNDPARALEAFSLVHLALGRSLEAGKKIRVKAEGKVNNVFNKSFQNYENRAMPLRHYQLSLSFQWKR